uniref:Amino acid transporter transmembrane domain-containing protein n=1 Tax=Calcidiscus leptoporus TaxID=127549 RepID=A0A7S0J1K6_9EUKA
MHFVFYREENAKHLNVIGGDSSNVLGVAVFNFTLLMTIPSWMNEKSPNVSVNHTIWGSMTAAALSFAMIGILGALATEKAADNMLQTLAAPGMPTLTRLSAFLFGVVIIGFGVPVSCIVIRYNIGLGKMLSPSSATFISTVLPWLLSWTLYQGHRALDVISYTGMVVNGLVNLVFPLVLTLAITAPTFLPRRRPVLFQPLSATDVLPIPREWESSRPALFRALLALTIPAIVIATGLKIVSELSGT